MDLFESETSFRWSSGKLVYKKDGPSLRSLVQDLGEDIRALGAERS